MYLKCAIVSIVLLDKHLGSIWEPGHSWELRCRATTVGRLMPEHLWAATPALVAPAPATSWEQTLHFELPKPVLLPGRPVPGQGSGGSNKGNMFCTGSLN